MVFFGRHGDVIHMAISLKSRNEYIPISAGVLPSGIKFDAEIKVVGTTRKRLMIRPLVLFSFRLLNCWRAMVSGLFFVTEFTQVSTCDIVVGDQKASDTRRRQSWCSIIKMEEVDYSLTQTDDQLPCLEVEGHHAANIAKWLCTHRVCWQTKFSEAYAILHYVIFMIYSGN